MKRIAYLRVAQETNSFSPVLSTLDDFRRTHWFEGEALAEVCSPRGTEAEGFMRNGELSGFVKAATRLGRGRIELVPLFSAWAIPSGPLSRETFLYFRDRIADELRAAGPLDGVMISLHGALGAEGIPDPEADFLEAARAVVGDIPIACTLDLHGQLDARKVRQIDILAAYRTNPHRDHAEVGRRAGEMLVRTVLGEITPTRAWRSLPLVLGGGSTIDFMPTMRPVFRRMRQMELDPRVLYCSLFMCHVWNKHPELGWSTHVMTDGDPALAEALAEELAELAWSVRHAQPPLFPTATEAIAQARAARLARHLGTVCMCDASDIVSAGAAGENTRLVKALLDQAQGLLTYAPIRDAVAMERHWELPVGAEFSDAVGGRLHPELNTPIPVRGKVVRKTVHPNMGRMMVLDADHVKLVITQHAPMAMKPSFYGEVGLNPWRADICVVKSLFPFRLYFLAHNRKTIYARTRGVTDLDAVTRQEFTHPVHPTDHVTDWRPVDRARRGLEAVAPTA
jgi:microcystin degradation protein MlrC